MFFEMLNQAVCLVPVDGAVCFSDATACFNQKINTTQTFN